MSFNMQKYDEVRFHSDELTHKRIKALLLWFEYEVYKRNLSPDLQLILMDRWINKIVSQEYYEVVPFFKDMKTDMINKRKNPSEIVVEPIVELVTDNVTDIKETGSFLTICWNKIKNVFTN